MWPCICSPLKSLRCVPFIEPLIAKPCHSRNAKAAWWKGQFHRETWMYLLRVLQMTTCVGVKLCSSKHQCIALHSIYWQKCCTKWVTTSQCLQLWQPYGIDWSIWSNVVISSCFYWYKKKWPFGSLYAPYSCFLTSMADCTHKYWICVIDFPCYVNTKLGRFSTLLSWKLKIYCVLFRAYSRYLGHCLETW